MSLRRNLRRELFPLFSKSKFSDSSTNLMSTTDAIFSKQNDQAEQQSGHYVITLLHQSGVFPKIALQLDYELKLDLKRLSWEEAHVWGMSSLTS